MLVVLARVFALREDWRVALRRHLPQHTAWNKGKKKAESNFFRYWHRRSTNTVQILYKYCAFMETCRKEKVFLGPFFLFPENVRENTTLLYRLFLLPFAVNMFILMIAD